jgi:hypothetical protein
MNRGFMSVSGKKAKIRNAVMPAVTESGIWLSVTRLRRLYSWNGRRKSRILPDASFQVGLLMGT